MINPEASSPEQRQVYRLLITLQGIEPQIWRRVYVPTDITLSGLHLTIQAAMGWEDRHLWNFHIDGQLYSLEELDDWAPPMGDARVIGLDQLIEVGDSFTYLYDFGDSWEHLVQVEEIAMAETGLEYPTCIDAQRAGPPEDSGGAPGYQELLEVLADPTDPYHQNLVAWLDGEFDPGAVDIGQINRRLAGLLADLDQETTALDPIGTGAAEAFPERAIQAQARAEAAIREVRDRAEEILDQVLTENPAATIDDLNRALAEADPELDHFTESAFGGLSPLEVNQLLSADLGEETGDPTGVIHLNQELPISILADSTTLHNARLLLRILAGRDRTRTTMKGNMPRAVVSEFFQEMAWPIESLFIRDSLRGRKVINADDIAPLRPIHILLEIAGLIEERKRSVSLTDRGYDLLQESQAGALFTLLFRTHFRHFNLAYLDQNLLAPGFQQTLVYTLFQFGRTGPEWRLPRELTTALILPVVLGEMWDTAGNDQSAQILEDRLLRPLVGFGLAEVQARPRPPEEWRRRYHYRKSALFNRFLSFYLSAGFGAFVEPTVWH